MQIKNSQYQELDEKDLLVFVIGYEQRSTYIYEKSIKTRNKENTLALQVGYKACNLKVTSTLEKKEISIVNCQYEDTEKVKNIIIGFYIQQSKSGKQLRLHVDYSSMPRSWYCAIPIYMRNILYCENDLFLWYSAGEYPNSHKNYPSAGIDSITVFAGIALPSVDIKRYHILGLGFDSIRTETVKSIVEPDTLIACYSYNPQNGEIRNQICEVNKRIIQSASLTVAIPLDNFSGMVDKLCSLVYDLLLKDAQIILIPDGPKPLIMAMSLVPELIGKPGITCLHISANKVDYPEISIRRRENEIFGFQILR